MATWQHWPCCTCRLRWTRRHGRSLHPTAPSLCIIWHPRSCISSYLTDRQQRVWHDGMQSTYEFIKFGVPQGSVLGPQTFVPLHCRSCAAHRRTSSARRRRHHIPDRDVQVGHDSVHPVQSAGDLGVYVDDGGMTMRAHINHVLSSCYGTLRQLRSITRSLPSHALNTLVTGLVHSRSDYCNVVFAGLPACDVQHSTIITVITVCCYCKAQTKLV